MMKIDILVQCVILVGTSLRGVNLKPQQFDFGFNNFGGNAASFSSISTFSSSSGGGIAFNNGGITGNSQVFPNPLLFGQQITNQGAYGGDYKNQNLNSQAIGNDVGNVNQNAINNINPNNPFLQSAITTKPPSRVTSKKPSSSKKRDSPPRERNKPPKKPVPPVAPTMNNKNVQKKKDSEKNKKSKKSKNKKKKRVSEIKYEQYLSSIFPDEPVDEEVTDLNGRELARPGQYPHMGAIGYRNTVVNKTEYKCGASLISNIFVLTAAHCTQFNGLTPSYVRFGDLNLKAAEEDIDPQTRRVSGVINHPNYNVNSLYNDIALLKLSKPVIFTEFVQPIRLWHHEDVPFTNAFAMGFGAVQFAGAMTNRLTEFNLTIMANDLCAKLLPKQSNANNGIVDSQICAIDYRKKGSDTFQGDSGGPLQVTFAKGPFRRLHSYLIGITSYGVVGVTRYPGIYTRVSSFIDWMEQNVWAADYYDE